MGPSSGTLTFRRRTMLCWLSLFFKPLPVDCFSALSLAWPPGTGNGFSTSGALLLELSTGSFLSLGKSWYFLGGSGCCILQVNGLSEGGRGDVF